MSDWRSIIPIVYIVGSGIPDTVNVLIDFDVPVVLPGTNDVQVEATLSGTGAFPGVFADGCNNTQVSSFVGSGITYATDVDNDVYYNDGVYTVNDIVVDKYYGHGSDAYNDLDVEHYIFSDMPPKKENIPVEFKLYIGYVPYDYNVSVDVFFHTDRYYYNTCDVFSTTSGITYYYDSDVEVETGRTIYICNTMFCSLEATTSGINNDMFCSVSGIGYHNADIEIESGSTIDIVSDVFSTAQTMSSGVLNDIRIYSLECGTFFLDVEDYDAASVVAWVDIRDYLFDIDTVNSYFVVDDQQVAVTFSGIDDGYRMFYNPPDDFYGLGDVVYKAHITNVVGDILEKSYHLLYGYNLAIDQHEFVDWGYLNEVIVDMEATNKVECVNTAYDAFYFITRDFFTSSLNVSIRAIESVDLGVTIYPQNTFFFYDRTYTVTISGVKDFAGNEMPPFDYTFTIEDGEG